MMQTFYSPLHLSYVSNLTDPWLYKSFSLCIVVGDENVLVSDNFHQTLEACGGNREADDSDTDESRPQPQPKPRSKCKQLGTSTVEPQSTEQDLQELHVHTSPVPCVTSQLGNIGR